MSWWYLWIDRIPSEAGVEDKVPSPRRISTYASVYYSVLVSPIACRALGCGNYPCHLPLPVSPSPFWDAAPGRRGQTFPHSNSLEPLGLEAWWSSAALYFFSFLSPCPFVRLAVKTNNNPPSSKSPRGRCAKDTSQAQGKSQKRPSQPGIQNRYQAVPLSLDPFQTD